MKTLGISFCLFLPLVMAQRFLYLPTSCYRQLDESKCEMGYPKYFFNTTSELCELTQLSRCKGKRPNFFTTLSRCMQRCGCHADAHTGPCDGNQIRYYYDSRYKFCMSFRYGGCGGNMNNFESFWHCQMFCKPRPFSNLFES